MRAVWFIAKFELLLNCNKHPNYSPKSRTPQEPQNVGCKFYGQNIYNEKDIQSYTALWCVFDNDIFIQE